jgi:hypothetical protein
VEFVCEVIDVNGALGVLLRVEVLGLRLSRSGRAAVEADEGERSASRLLRVRRFGAKWGVVGNDQDSVSFGQLAHRGAAVLKAIWAWEARAWIVHRDAFTFHVLRNSGT